MSFSLWSEETKLPLQQIRVTDLTVMLPGPMITRILAQYGAHVIKVEALPDGDATRTLLPRSAIGDLLNQGKKSVALDIKSAKGIELVQRMASESDVFVENFRDGVMDRLGLGYAALSEINPDLLYVSVRGFEGRLAPKAGHDFNFVASSGCGEWFLENGHPNYSTHFADLIGGAYVPCIKILCYLADPDRSGRHLVLNMDESFRALYLPRAYDAFRSEAMSDTERSQFGAHTHLNGQRPHSRYYLCRDGQWVSLNAIQKKHWDAFCDVVDRSQWKDRMEDSVLCAEMEKLFQDAPSSYWEALASSHDICLTRVVSWADHLNTTQARALLGSDPLSWAGFQPNSKLEKSPQLGEDTFTILNALGLTNAEITQLADDKVIAQAFSS